MQELSAANRIFLSLLRRRMGHADGAAPFGLDRRCGALILHLDAEGLDLAASCPFALFSLDFENRAAWLGLLERRVSEPGLPSWSLDEPELNQFLLMVLAAIRYLSCREPYAASMLYGMSPDLSRKLANLDLVTLAKLASDARSRLRVTLADSPIFWRDFLLLSRDRVTRGAAAVRVLGLQLTMQRALGLTNCHANGGRLIRSG